MSKKYSNLLSPARVGNMVFKNRLIASPSMPHFVQASEPYPTEALITHYANKAKNGAGIVTVTHFGPETVIPEKFIGFNNRGYTMHRAAVAGNSPPSFQNNLEVYLSLLAESIHFYGAKASMGIVANVPRQYDASRGIARMDPESSVGEELPFDMFDKVAEDFALQAAFMKDIGFDMVLLHMCYRVQLLGRFLSPLTNKRTDQYGGNLENRVRFPIMVADRIKQKCGKDFFIEASISGCESAPGGLTLEDTIKCAKMFAGHFDLLELRSGEQDPAHPTGFIPQATPFLYMAEAIKKSGADIAVVTIGGYQDLDVCEDVIATGKADFIAMARSWISNPEYGRLAYEGRNEDVVPCIRCNKCHRSSYAEPWNSVCSVNPIWGLEHKIERMIQLPAWKKNIAVVGGGLAGMEAALVASGRGHKVTIYEKTSALGGLLKTSDIVSFKWPLKDFKNYLIRQIVKSDIEVYLNTEATPAMLSKGKYDVVFAAVGSEPIIPPISGINRENVMFAPDVYRSENTLAKNIVVIGGGEVGVETGMYLAEKGHNVTVLEMGDVLAPDATPVHYYSMFKEAWEKLENFKFILQARCNSIGANNVTYVDAEGKECEIATDSVVIAAGMQPKTDLALTFSGAGDRLLLIGDCNKVGNVQKTMRNAFGMASMI